MTRNELKNIIKECVLEIISDTQTQPNVDEDPKVKKLRRDVELKKHAVEKEKQKSLDNALRVSKEKRKLVNTDLDGRKDADKEISAIKDKKDASKAAMNAAMQQAKSIK